MTIRSLILASSICLFATLALPLGTARADTWAFVGSRYQAMGGTGVAFSEDSTTTYWNQSNLAWKKAWDVQLPVTVDLFVENKALQDLSNLVQEAGEISALIDLALKCLPNCASQALDAADQGDLMGFLVQLGTYGKEGQSVHGNVSLGLIGRYNNFGFSAMSMTEATVFPNVDLSTLGFAISAVDAIIGTDLDLTDQCCQPPNDTVLMGQLWNEVSGLNVWEGPEQIGHLIWLAEQAAGSTSAPGIRSLLGNIVRSTAAGTSNASLPAAQQNFSGALVAGVSTQEFGLSYGRKIPIPYYSRTEGMTHEVLSYLHNKMAVGGAIKYMMGITFVKTFAYDDPDLGGLNFLDQNVQKISHDAGLDLSFSMRPVDWFHWGFVARNVNGPTFDLARPILLRTGGTTEIERAAQVRLGTAFMPIKHMTLAFDVDLTENRITTLPGFRSRIVSLGAEYAIPMGSKVDLALRLGGNGNIAGEVDQNWGMTGGLGLRLWDFVLDLSAGASFSDERVRTDTYETTNIPSRLNIGLGLKWEHSL